MFKYANEYASICIRPSPAVRMCYPDPTAEKIEIKAAIDKPFICETALTVNIIDVKELRSFMFKIPAGYKWDGASIPRIFWRIIGVKTDPQFLVASLIHDVLCENHHYVENDRYFADRVFDCLLEAAGVCAFKRWLMFHSVDNWQKLCKW